MKTCYYKGTQPGCTKKMKLKYCPFCGARIVDVHDQIDQLQKIAEECREGRMNGGEIG